jgi:glyoxylase-like metal-dependent hydrolase (beta-lactamase superfamily II)
MEKKMECVIVGEIETNCWLYPLKEGPSELQPCVVIDPGDEAEKIIFRLQKLNWVPLYIFLTHGHFDHLAALSDLLSAFGKGVFGTAAVPKVGIHREDAHYLGEGAFSVHQSSLAAAGGNPDYVKSLWKPMPVADILFEEGDAAGPFKVLHIPGHTQGSIGLYDEKAGVLFSGDTLFKRDWGRTDLPGGDEALIRQSLKRLLSLDEGTAVYPGHGSATTIKEEEGLLG